MLSKNNSFQDRCSSAFRRLIWRVGRKLYCFARNELPAGPQTNGEYRLLDLCLRETKQQSVILVDIGANKGEWSVAALDYSSRYDRQACVHIFEPSSDSFSRLQRLFDMQPVKVNKSALSNISSTSRLFVCGDLCGTNSLYGDQGGAPEEIETISLDEYAAQQRLEHIDFVKSDTEGHDFMVMQGAENLLKLGKVTIWQFEYNWRWINARSYIKDVFDFLRDKPYSIGRLSQSGIEIYKNWHPELERYFETNFVLIRKGNEDVSKILTRSRFNYCNVSVRDES